MINTLAQTGKTLKTAALLASTSLLIACGGGGGSDSDSASGSSASASSTTIQGSAVKGVISNGLVSAYLLENNAGALTVADAPIVSGVRTNASGQYTLVLPGNFTNETVVIEITADAATRMACDVPDGCGAGVAFGDSFALNDEFSMRGVAMGVNSGSQFSAHVSPLSHMALAYAESNVNGLSSSAINSAFSHVEDILDLDAGIIDLAPADITALDSIANLTKAEIEMGIVSAAFLSLLNTPDWESIDEVLDHVAEKMSSSGELASVNMGALRDVTLDDVFYSANDITEDLVAANPESEYADELSIVDAETASSYDAVAEDTQQIDPVSIVSHPQSVSVDEGDAFLFSVAANGGGSLSFQWRKNGIAINGASASTLSVSSSVLNDGGLYDVIVSNSVGSVTSQSALLTVNEVVVVPDLDPVSIIAQPQGVTVEEGEAFSFSVQASGSDIAYQWRKDGNTIPGATDASLTVSPSEAGDEGYYDVVISNALGSVTSDAAQLTVNPVNLTASIELSWDIPLQREDGSALELYEINGYVIAYGTNSGNLTNQVQVSGASQTSALIEELNAGTYYFAIATVDSEGVQGNYSEEISQTVM